MVQSMLLYARYPAKDNKTRKVDIKTIPVGPMLGFFIIYFILETV